ncbi:unnamed protein product [Absidia cylindrospora]
MELKQSKKKQKLTTSDDASVSAAAATLTSFTQSSDEDLTVRQPYRKNKKPTKQQQQLEQQQQQEEGCGDREDCSGGIGKYVCGQCGLAYQHAICLKRHSWDHTEGWRNRNWGMSKRQQVQILEAAQILLEIAKG